MIGKIFLGTARFGLKDYGINTDGEAIDYELISAILKAAHVAGITTLDTAPVYGDPVHGYVEEKIGRFMREQGLSFEIATKLPKLQSDPEGGLGKYVQESIGASRKALGVEKLDYYFLHEYGDWIKHPELLQYISEARDRGEVGSIGIAIYHPHELETIFEKGDGIDIIQVPYNMLDHINWKELLSVVKGKFFDIFARSAFLQGLFFSDQATIIENVNEEAYQCVKLLNELSREYGIPIGQLALRYVAANENIDHILIGCDSKKQLIENIGALTDWPPLEPGIISTLENRVRELQASMPHQAVAKIMDPRQWGNNLWKNATSPSSSPST